jgi:hypothetical protein
MSSLASAVLVAAMGLTSPADVLNSPEEISKRCLPQASGEKTLYSSDFKWGFSLSEMLDRFKEVYVLDRRLGRRAYFDSASQSLLLPYDSVRGGSVTLPLAFVRSVQRHVEQAMRFGYAEGVFFPDMGHSHFLIPTEKYIRDYQDVPVDKIARLYEMFFRDPELKVVYHTAEQLQMIDKNSVLLPDRHIQWRFFSRNLVGDNLGLGRMELHQNHAHKNNTMHEADGYTWWGAGFNISAHQRGCFAYSDRGQIRYFDLSLFDLEPETSE